MGPTRRGFCAGLAALPLLRPAFGQGMRSLTAGKATVQLAPDAYPATPVWAYDGTLPGTVLRAPQGGRLERRLVNALDVPTSIHWHGIRIDNAMDGVAGLTQDAVPPGAGFDYAFDLPDAGTYWYHAHVNSTEQVARGLAGALIVDESAPPDIDRDEVLMIGDWLIDPDTGSFVDNFAAPMTLSHGGRTGNLVGVNGRHDFSLSAGRNERLRLRLINSANARIFGLRLEGLRGWTVALDGMPLAEPVPVTDMLVLAPAQRIDLIVDVTAEPGAAAGIGFADGDDGWGMLAAIEVTGHSATVARDRPAPLPPNPRMQIGGIEAAPVLDMPLQGGAMRGLKGARFDGQDMGWRELVRNGQFWALAGQVGLGTAPFATLSRGETARIRMANDTIFPHAMHLHGMHFRVRAPDGTLGPLRDTVLVMPNDMAEIVFVADNPGKWLLHCHMLGHAASGMTNWVMVA
ncbi:multicopper oxidase family protein [Paracoccus sp. 1_MG-2023]|uniref:multicopper oxidase family protein n=1 Tax=unclassified Paracoccus (in: a-proteobacteria) TaxID=2688777 RepID=UPI001C08BC5E|nr:MULTISPECIES: multicopper oxidase family protein [unclassified Paracoccus (in: a-proteobacteria)]MBU2959172.1 multicopper oxidase family protein [Paracoccus sp. C2R09]MDO6670091.1 multicopper oxidase family protein [Paracoccus sp. 1_MG-2023]